jgi:hypothetical protein
MMKTGCPHIGTDPFPEHVTGISIAQENNASANVWLALRTDLSY